MGRVDGKAIDSALNKLFADWRAAQPGHRLFLDGAVYAERYAAEPIRLLFILKEVNVSPTEADWDLREYLRDGARAATWNNVTRWAQAVMDKASWDQVTTIDEGNRKDVLGRVAVMNLNKRGGRACAKYQRLREAVDRDRERLRAEYAILAPNLVVFGGDLTADVAGEAIFDLPASAWTKTSSGVWVSRSPTDVPLVAMPHPQARRGAHDMFEAIVGALQLLGYSDLARARPC